MKLIEELQKMKTMKIVSILVIIVGFSQCGSLKFEQHPPFKITSAVYQNWSGGQPGVKGMNVKITYTSNKTIEFDSLYFEKRAVDLQIKDSKTNKLVVGYFTSNETNDLIFDANPVKELQNPIPSMKQFPFELEKNEAVISYKIKGKIKYFKVSSVKKEKNLFFPSAPK